MDLSGRWFDPGVPVLGGLNATVEEARLIPSRTTLVLEIIIIFMCLGAVTGNILVIVIVAATKTFHSVTSVLIINLAISDLLVGVGVMPFVAVSIINSSWVNSSDLCLYVGYTASVYCTASVLTLAAIALDRYYSIMDCLRYSSRCTLWKTCAVVLWIWLQALATSCPPLLGWSAVGFVGPMYSCAVNWSNSPSYTTFMVALSFFVPAAVILFCYVNIVKVARSHARRIHTLEDHFQRSRNPDANIPSSGDTTHHAPSRLVYHLSGSFVSELRGEVAPEETPVSPASSSPPPRGFFSFLAQSASHVTQHNLQQHQHQHQHGVLRLFVVIAAFFLCWTPYMGVALVQATETALLGKSNLVPPTAVTFSYWLVLLNSDINPLLYALLSKRFQGALQNLRKKIRTRLGTVVGRGGEVRSEREYRMSDPCILTTNTPALGATSESSLPNESRYCSSVFTVSTDFEHQPKHQLCEVFLPGSDSASSSLWQVSGGQRADCLQVPSRTQEGSRLPFSALTTETHATFFYGQITVTVEHIDVC